MQSSRADWQVLDDVYRVLLVEGLSELLSELRYLLLSGGPYCGDKRAQSQVHGGAGR